MTKTMIAVSWVSVNNDPYERARDGAYQEREGSKVPGPTLEFLLNPASPVCGHVKKIYLLARRPRTPEPGERRVQPREEDVVREVREALSERAPTIEVELVWWDTDAAPTDHKELFRFTAKTLPAIRRSNPRAPLVVNLSPGTPAKHTALLLALQARLAGEPVRAFQGTPRDKRRTKDDVVQEVPWNLLAELAATPTEDVSDSGRAAAWTLDRARSDGMREVADRIHRFGGVPFPVLIIGARGTGKTEVAERLRRTYREWALKSENKWDFHLNCAEFRGDPNMLRSELFGHKKGSSNQADRDKTGLLEKAAEDCVFLDEIHWMDPQAQGLLLLALQRKGKFRRIGSDEEIPARFRLLVATNQTPSVLRERLMPDFLDRVSDLIIPLPELRDSREDLPDIWKSVVRRACDELVQGDGTRAVTGGVEGMVAEFQPHHVRIERALSTMSLPGNFRDLEKLARRLIVAGLARGRFFSLKDDLVKQEIEQLRKDERTEAERGTGDGSSLLDELPTVARCEDFLRDVRDTGAALSAPAAVDEWERRLLVAAHAVAGNGTKAAGLLGMNPRTLNAKMEKWNGSSDPSTTRRPRPKGSSNKE